MNGVEQLLSDACDYVETRLQGDRGLRLELDTLVKAGQRPHIVRQLNVISDLSLGIGFTPTSEITGA